MEGVLRASGSSAWATSATATAVSGIVYSAVSTTAAAVAAEAVTTLTASSAGGGGGGPQHKGDDYIIDLNRTDNLPPVRPPPGIVPELQNPPQAEQGPNVAGLAVCLSIATILFAVRSYVKFKIRRNYLVEDGE